MACFALAAGRIRRQGGGGRESRETSVQSKKRQNRNSQSQQLAKLHHFTVEQMVVRTSHTTMQKRSRISASREGIGGVPPSLRHESGQT
jgi:hypothetical protein